MNIENRQGKWRDSDLQYDISAGYWISSGVTHHARARVETLLPDGFEQYGRILHPVESVDELGRQRWLRWSDIARATDSSAHPRMQLHSMLEQAPKDFLRSSPPAPRTHVQPWENQLEALAQILRHHTGRSEDCWFAFWEGNTAFDGIAPDVPKLHVAGFRYYLLRGDISRASATFRGIYAHIWWPTDQSWCVTSHFDFPSTYVGGSSACVNDLLSNDTLETWRVSPEDPVTADSDRLNT